MSGFGFFFSLENLKSAALIVFIGNLILIQVFWEIWCPVSFMSRGVPFFTVTEVYYLYLMQLCLMWVVDALVFIFWFYFKQTCPIIEGFI